VKMTGQNKFLKTVPNLNTPIGQKKKKKNQKKKKYKTNDPFFLKKKKRAGTRPL
jgi:peroxiredoxin